MTLVEILIAVSVIALIFVIAIPLVTLSIRSRENAECVRQLHAAVNAFELYAAETGAYPGDQIVPSETTVAVMDDYYFPYFKIDWWGQTTPLGGRWDWDVGYHGFAQSVSIWQPTASAAQLTDFDRMVDDGDLNTGRFRKVGSQYHYILND